MPWTMYDEQGGALQGTSYSLYKEVAQGQFWKLLDEAEPDGNGDIILTPGNLNGISRLKAVYHLKTDRTGATIDQILCVVNGDTGNNYVNAWAAQYTTPTYTDGMGYGGATDTPLHRRILWCACSQSQDNTWSDGEIEIDGVADSTLWTVFRAMSMVHRTQDASYAHFNHEIMTWKNTSLVTSLKFTPENGAFLTGCTMKLYGLIETDVVLDARLVPDRALGNGQVNGELIGKIELWPSSVIPTGYLLCDGTVYDIADYPDLYSVLGDTWGGDGVTTFGVPNFTAKVPVGADPTASVLPLNNEVGDSGGEVEHTLTINEMPSHYHGVKYNVINLAPGGSPQAIINGAGAYLYGGVSTGGGLPHNNMQPYAIVNYIIKAV